MKLPKFSPGETVVYSPTGSEFTINHVVCQENSPDKGLFKWQYSDSDVWDSNKTLYKEEVLSKKPQEKKLYAYFAKLTTINGMGVECVIHHPHKEYCDKSALLTPAPQYDIEFKGERV